MSIGIYFRIKIHCMAFNHNFDKCFACSLKMSVCFNGNNPNYSL